MSSRGTARAWARSRRAAPGLPAPTTITPSPRAWPKWWLPDEVTFIDAVPETSVGKLDKKVLRERFKAWKPKA